MKKNNIGMLYAIIINIDEAYAWLSSHLSIIQFCSKFITELGQHKRINLEP
jgi:hypothetical protein